MPSSIANAQLIEIEPGETIQQKLLNGNLCATSTLQAADKGGVEGGVLALTQHVVHSINKIVWKAIEAHLGRHNETGKAPWDFKRSIYKTLN